MTGITRTELERKLARHLTEEVERLMAATDIPHEHELLESRLRQVRRRPRPLHLAGVAAAAVAAAVTAIVLVATRSTPAHEFAPGAGALPQPAGVPLTIYRSSASATGSVLRVDSFLDTRGRWCIATLDSSAARTPADYACRSARLPASGHGFGAVYGNDDAPTYDNFRSWFAGVGTADVKRVTVVFDNGLVRTATVRDQGSAHGVVFSFAWPTTTSNPAYYRAYAADGHLIEQVPIKTAIVPK